MAAFQHVDQATGELIETDDPIRFWMALRRAAQFDIAEWTARRRDAVAAQFVARGAKELVSFSESAMRLDDRVDGTNAETRKAQLEVLLEADAHYQDSRSVQNRAEQEAAHAEIEADAAYARVRVTLRDLEVMAALYSPQEATLSMGGQRD